MDDARSQVSLAFQSIRHYGLYFRQSPSMYNEYADATHIERRMEELKQMHCEVVIFILNAVSEDIYKAIKYLGNQKLGLITQYGCPPSSSPSSCDFALQMHRFRCYHSKYQNT